MPSACAAMPGRDLSSTFIAILKPPPSGPSMFAAGTRHSVNVSSTVGEPRMPIFFSSLPTANPGVPFSTTNALIPFAPFSGSVTAKTVTMSAMLPWVIQIFVPSST